LFDELGGEGNSTTTLSPGDPCLVRVFVLGWRGKAGFTAWMSTLTRPFQGSPHRGRGNNRWECSHGLSIPTCGATVASQRENDWRQAQRLTSRIPIGRIAVPRSWYCCATTKWYPKNLPLGDAMLFATAQ